MCNFRPKRFDFDDGHNKNELANNLPLRLRLRLMVACLYADAPKSL